MHNDDEILAIAQKALGLPNAKGFFAHEEIEDGYPDLYVEFALSMISEGIQTKDIHNLAACFKDDRICHSEIKMLIRRAISSLSIDKIDRLTAISLYSMFKIEQFITGSLEPRRCIRILTELSEKNPEIRFLHSFPSLLYTLDGDGQFDKDLIIKKFRSIANSVICDVVFEIAINKTGLVGIKYVG